MLSDIGVPLGVAKPKATLSHFPANTLKLRHGLLERLVPSNTLPARVFRAFWVCAPQRIELPLRLVDYFSSGAPLDTERLSGRMFRVGLLPRRAQLGLLRSEICRAHKIRGFYFRS
jgi:hypothetical protein